MEVIGSATATMLSRAFSMIAVLCLLRRPELIIRLRGYLSIRPIWSQIRRILYLGIPSGIENSMFQFGKLAIQSTVSMMGTAAIAAQGMTNILENLNGILAIGIGVGLMTVVGECMGAGRKDEAAYYIKKMTAVSEVVCDCKLSADLCARTSNYDFRWNGSKECKNVYLHGWLYHHCKTNCVVVGIYTGIRFPCSRGCEIHDGYIGAHHVVLSCHTCDVSCESARFRTDCSMDRNVH